MRFGTFRIHLVFISIGLALAGAPKLAAAWPHDPSENRSISLDPATKRGLSVVPDANGGFFVVWEDYRGGGDADIYLAHHNAQGLDLVPEFPLCSATGSQEHPRAVSDGAGGVLVTWDDQRGGNRDIYAQRIDSQGVVLWTANGALVCSTPSTQENPTIVPDLSNGAIVAWQDHRGGASDIYAQVLDGSGAPTWPGDGVVLCDAVGEQVAPVGVVDGFGGAIFVWRDNRNGNEDLYAQRIIGPSMGYMPNGMPVCTALGDQTQPVVVSDQRNGAVIAWTDQRGGTLDIYAARLTWTGWLPWTSDGVPVCTEASTQFYPIIAADGSGGAYVAWTDYRSGDFEAYFQHVLLGGGIPLTPGGVNLASAPGAQSPNAVVADGAGGVIVAWQDRRYGGYDIYAQRVNALGYFGWSYGGVLVSGALGDQTAPLAISDGASGALFLWVDERIGGNQIYGQRVDRYGVLGEAEPAIVNVKDVTNDQGGHVKISWNASYIEAEPYESIIDYWILRSVPPNRLTSTQREQLGALGISTSLDGEPEIIVTTAGGLNYYWEFIGTTPTLGLEHYSFVAPTASDSVAASNPRTAFMIQARGNAGQRWNSAPDSGYSVDNLVPASPTPLAGEHYGGTLHLTWDPNTEPDLAAYRVYRGPTPGFVPAAGNLIGTVENPEYADAAPEGSYYKVTAIDVHGNESPAALYSPQIVDVANDSRSAGLFLAPVTPNPARGAMRVQWGLGVPGAVTLEVIDLQGRRIRTLARGTLAAGSFAHGWDGRDDGGRRAPGGAYFVRLTTTDRTLSRRVTLMR